MGKNFIICRPDLASLNKRNELVISGRHAHKFLFSSFHLPLSPNSFFDSNSARAFVVLTHVVMNFLLAILSEEFRIRRAVRNQIVIKMPSQISLWRQITYNHGQKSWDTFAFLGRFPIHTGPTPPLTPQTMLDACIQNFSEFQLCIGWGEGEMQENFENDARF